MRACLKPMRNSPCVRVYREGPVVITMAKHGRNMFSAVIEIGGYQASRQIRAKNWNEAVACLAGFQEQIYEAMHSGLAMFGCISEFTTSR